MPRCLRPVGTPFATATAARTAYLGDNPAPTVVRHTLALLALIAALTGCSLVGSDEGDLAFDGVVAYTTVEGGAWLLESDAGETYEPVNLPAEFEEEGLRVRVEAEVREDLGSVVMVGTLIEIERIERL